MHSFDGHLDKQTLILLENTARKGELRWTQFLVVTTVGQTYGYYISLNSPGCTTIYDGCLLRSNYGP